MIRNTAGLLVYHKEKVLLVLQRDTLRYSIPKGEICQSESILETSIRETYEETGLLVPFKYIRKRRYICSVKYGDYCRKLFYYKVYLPTSYRVSPLKADDVEVVSSDFYSIDVALSIIQTSQIAILWDGGSHIDNRILDKLVNMGWLNRNVHPTAELYIYNYTDRCKYEQAWNEVTMWCRGLVTNKNGDVVVRPLKKFFEYNQLYPECCPESQLFEISEKIDGFLGITYWVGDLPYIATRDSFISFPALRGSSLLYSKYGGEIARMNPRYSYLFEIVFPNNYLVLDYGDVEDMFLIDILDNQTGESVLRRHEFMSFPIISRSPGKYNLEHYMAQNKKNKEGFVVIFPDGERLKIKFPWFKDEFLKKHGKEDI